MAVDGSMARLWHYRQRSVGDLRHLWLVTWITGS